MQARQSEVSDSQSTCDVGNSEQREVAHEQEGKSGEFGLGNNKQDTDRNGARTTSSILPSRLIMPGFCGTKMARGYVVSFYILLVLSVIFFSIFQCPSFRALHS